MFRRDIDEGRRTRPAVQIFVGAADREIGFRTGKIDRNGAGRMGEVPHRDHARVMGLFCQRLHVVQAAGAVVDLGDHQHRHAVIDRGLDLFRFDDLEHMALIERFEQPLAI
jgi:hypothetical protein